MTQESQTLINLFGATGDLAARKLYPALFSLYKRKNYLRTSRLLELDDANGQPKNYNQLSASRSKMMTKH